MNERQRNAFEDEILLARLLIARVRFPKAFLHLEKAHILGQKSVRAHVLVHWLMLRVEFSRRNFAAVWGQAVRILLGAVGSAVGFVPIGNTGGTNISMFKRLPIDPILAKLMADDS